jgi:hypothetical protein
MHDWKVERMNLMMPVTFIWLHKVVKVRREDLEVDERTVLRWLLMKLGVAI